MIHRNLRLLIALSSILTITAPATAGTIKSQRSSVFGDQIFDYSQRIGSSYKFKERNTGTYFENKGLGIGRYKGDIQILGSDWESFTNSNNRVGPVTNSAGIVEFDVSGLKISSKAKITLGLADTRSKQYKSYKQSDLTALPNKIKVSGYIGDGKSSLSDESISAIPITTITTNPGQNIRTSSKTNCLTGCIYNVDVGGFVKDAVSFGKQFVGFRFEPGTTDTNENFGTQAQLFIEDEPSGVPLNSRINAVLSSADKERNPANERIDFSFTPYTTSLGNAVKLDDLAQALGYEDFNYLQIVEKVSSSETWFTGKGERIAHRGTITNPLGNGTFFDPLPEGNIIFSYEDFESQSLANQSFLNETQLDKEQLLLARNSPSFLKYDNLPFVLDIPIDPSFKSDTTITMNDTPYLAFNPNLEFRKFHTMLVGVKNGGTAFDVFNGQGVRWESNTTCNTFPLSNCNGETNVAASSNQTLPFPVTGGIEITDSNVTFDEFSDDLIALLTANNGTLIDIDGTIFNPEGSGSNNGGNNNDSSGSGDNGNSSNSGSQKVPEPSTLLGLGLVIGLGAIYEKNKNASLNNQEQKQ